MARTYINTPVKETLLAAIETAVAAILDDASVTLFNTVSRGNPAKQAHEESQLPAAYILPLNERPPGGQFEEIEVHDLPVGVVVIGSGANAKTIQQDVVQLETRVIDALDNVQMGSIGAPLRWLGTDAPEANVILPTGSAMKTSGLVASFNLAAASTSVLNRQQKQPPAISSVA